MPTRTSDQLLNEAVFEALSTPGQEKVAIDAVNDFTRIRMREDGIYEKLQPPLTLANDELDRQVDTPKPVKVVDREPDSPAAISIPFATLPTNLYIRGTRYRVMFDRIVTPRFTTDVDELRTWVMDIRQILSDNAIKDMLAEDDSKYFAAFNAAIGGAADTVCNWSQTVQWETIDGGIGRETLLDAFKIMPRTDAHLEVDTVVCNNVTIKEVQKIRRDEMGGDFSQQVFKQGWAEAEFMNAKWIITIKRDLVPDDSLFMTADPQFIGKSYELEPTVMYIKREAYLLEFFAYRTKGGAIGHTAGLARADFR